MPPGADMTSNERMRRAEQLLARYLQEADGAPPAELAPLVKLHPDLEEELRALHARWLSVSGLLQ